jgi:threonine-phosphate decarboxylase
LHLHAAKGKRSTMNRLLHGGGIRAIAATLGVAEEDILDFSSNLNPLGPPVEVLEMLEEKDILKKEAITHPPEYPFELEEAVAQLWQMPQESLAVIPGSVYGIYALFQLISPATTVVHLPIFSEYPRTAQVVGSRLVTHQALEQRNFRLCLGEYSWKIEPGSEMAILCNPNNPTGYLMPFDEVDALARWCDREECYLVVDEAFIEFTSQKSAIHLVKDHSHLVVLRSFTKAYAIPGLRTGIMAGPEGLISRVKGTLPPWSISGVAQRACTLALQCNEHLENTRKLVREERERLKKGLEALGMKTYPSWVNYLLCSLPKGVSGEALHSKLIDLLILIRRCHDIPGLNDGFIRVSVRMPEENQRLLQALGEVLGQ